MARARRVVATTAEEKREVARSWFLEDPPNLPEAQREEWPAIRELIAWHLDNTVPITPDEWSGLIAEFNSQAPQTGLLDRINAVPPDKVQQEARRALRLYMWEHHGLVPDDLGFSDVPCRPTADVPRRMLEAYNLVAPTSALIPARLLLPPITPAFRYDGHEGLGRMSSSLVNLAIFTACVAPKAEWEQTAKGFPRYTYRAPSGEIVITLTPEVVSPTDLSSQLATMSKIRDELGIDDYNHLTILQEQVLTENRADWSAFITADALCDYRGLKPKMKDGYRAGHQDKNRTRVADSMNRLAHLHVRTDTLLIRELDSRGKIKYVPVDWNEKVIKINAAATRRDNDASLGWSYQFGKTFSTYMYKPNLFIAYLLQGVIALHDSKVVAKKIAHALALHLRIDAKNGRCYDLTMGDLMTQARISCNEQRPQRTIDSVEEGVREVVKAGLFRIESQGRVWDAHSPDVDRWTAVPTGSKGHGLLGTWKSQSIVIRADPNVEERYDRYRRRIGAQSTEEV